MYLCVVGAEEGAARTDSSSSMVESQQVKPKIEKKKRNHELAYCSERWRWISKDTDSKKS